MNNKTQNEQTRSNLKQIALALCLTFGAGGFLAACDNQGPAEEAGEEIDEAAEDAGDKLEEMREEAEENLEEAEEEIDDNV